MPKLPTCLPASFLLRPAPTAITTRAATVDSMIIAPYPIRQAWASLSSCLQVVPEDTTEWKPEMAPQAMVIKRKGKMGGASPGALVLMAGATRGGWARNRPSAPSPKR